MTEFTPISALIGGAFIGLAATILLIMNGNVAGISGIFSRALKSANQQDYWRILFLLGLIAGCFISFQFFDVKPPQIPDFSITTLIVSGLLVGFGTVYGNGCTSGHGVCGMARLSIRSIVATLTFVGTGIVTATLVAIFA
jgi:hypothetical protein